MALADLRRDYTAGTLDRGDMLADPISQFRVWFDEASRPAGGRFRRFGIALYKAFQELIGSQPVDPNAMVVATADAEGKPSARTVLLKGVDARGFVFFTNYRSQKGRELEANPHAALVFYWPSLERQVCVAGEVTLLSREESDAYFRSRPRGSRIAAWASDQSSPVQDRRALETSVRLVETRFAGKDVDPPPFWGGYLLAPRRIEFWQGRANRLHDRFQFTRDNAGNWTLTRICP